MPRRPVLAAAAPLAALALLLLADAAVAQPGGPPGRPATEVEVVNTPGVEVVNQPTVNVGNVPSVDVVNVPEVEVVNTPTVDLAPGAEVEVRDRDLPVFQPFLVRCEINLAELEQVDDILCGEALPPGKRLVIEYYSLRVISPTWPTVRFSVSSRDPGGAIVSSEINLPLVDCGVVAPASNCWQGSGTVRLYHTVTGFFNPLAFSRRGPWTGTASLVATFSGHYVSVP